MSMYTKVMVESIKNSGMWLVEAKIIAKKGSKGHAQSLEFRWSLLDSFHHIFWSLSPIYEIL